MTKELYKVPFRTYKILRTIMLFTIGAVLVLLSIVLPKTFGDRGLSIDESIAHADGPNSCGGQACVGDGDGCSCSGDSDSGGCDSSADGY